MKLEDWRLARNLSLADLAGAIGATRMAVWRYCAGQRIPRPGIMAAIQRVTGGAVGPADFYPPACAGAGQVAPPPVATGAGGSSPPQPDAGGPP